MILTIHAMAWFFSISKESLSSGQFSKSEYFSWVKGTQTVSSRKTGEIAHKPLKMCTVTAGIYSDKWRERWRKYKNHKLQETHKSLWSFIIIQTKSYPFKTCQIMPDTICSFKTQVLWSYLWSPLSFRVWSLLRSQQCMYLFYFVLLFYFQTLFLLPFITDTQNFVIRSR